jgi:hypothetical protein
LIVGRIAVIVHVVRGTRVTACAEDRREADGCWEVANAMTNQQLKGMIQAALQAIPVGGPVGTLDELIAGLSKRGPSGSYHAGELARHRHDPQALSRELSLALDLLESHPELLG